MAWHKRHHDWEAFDKIEIVTVPRYKTSGLSGDEWRVSATVRCWFKGVVVLELGGFSDMETARRMLDGKLLEAAFPIPDGVIAREKTACDQPGCGSDAIVRLKLKRLTSERGEYLHEQEHSSTCYRQFCDAHRERGDCGREDADDNYEPIDTGGAS